MNVGSLPASVTLPQLFAIPWFLPHPWSAGCVPEAGITGVATLPTKVVVWPDTRAPILLGTSGNQILPLFGQYITTEPSLQPYFDDYGTSGESNSAPLW